jgi:zinc transport system substrate-binding protein
MVKKKALSLILASLLLVTILAFLVFIFYRQNLVLSNGNNNTFLVTTSFYPLYYFTSQIGGDKILVKNITPPGAEPHDYDISTKDLITIQQSKLLILQAQDFEPWGEKIKNSLGKNSVKVIFASEGLVSDEIIKSDQKTIDPHIWLDPKLAKKEVENIEEALSSVYPEFAPFFKLNREKLEKKLDDLDGEFKSQLSLCKENTFVTSHEAFGYLAHAYGLQQVAIAGFSPEEEPTAQNLVALTNFVRSHNIRYVFFENLVSPKLAETLAGELGIKTLDLNPLEGLTVEDLNQGKNYFTEMKKNLTNLKTALACQ